MEPRGNNWDNFVINKRASLLTALPIRLLPQSELDDQALVDQDTTCDDLPTGVAIPAASILPPLSFEMGYELPFDEQATWIIPIISNPNTRLKIDTQFSGSERYISSIRKLIKSSGIYAISSLASPLVSLLLAPFLASNLSRTEFGALAVLTTFISLMAGVTQLGLGSAFFRSYNYDYESQSDRLGVLSTVVILISLISIPVAITMIIAASWLTSILFGNSSYIDAIRLAGLVVLVQNLSVPGFAWLRAESRAFFYSMLSIANLITALGATIVLVGVLHMGIAGSLIATGMGYTVVVICMLPFILLHAGIHLRLDIAKGLLTFGLPNVSNFISVWVLQLSDRYLLSHLGSLPQTASYAVAYSLGGVLAPVVIAPFALAWPTTMYAVAKKDNAQQVFQLVFRWFSIILLLAAFGSSIISTAILSLFFPPKYYYSAPIIPIIAASTLFYGIYTLFTIGAALRRKTWLAVIFTTSSALVNVVLNIILIPLFGAMGAAASTLIAYVVLAVIAYLINQLIYPIPYEIGRFIIALVIGIGLYYGSGYLLQSQGEYMTWGVYLGAFLLYSGCLILIGKLPMRGEGLNKKY